MSVIKELYNLKEELDKYSKKVENVQIEDIYNNFKDKNIQYDVFSLNDDFEDTFEDASTKLNQAIIKNFEKNFLPFYIDNKPIYPKRVDICKNYNDEQTNDENLESFSIALWFEDGKANNFYIHIGDYMTFDDKNISTSDYVDKVNNYIPDKCEVTVTINDSFIPYMEEDYVLNKDETRNIITDLIPINDKFFEEGMQIFNGTDYIMVTDELLLENYDRYDDLEDKYDDLEDYEEKEREELNVSKDEYYYYKLLKEQRNINSDFLYEGKVKRENVHYIKIDLDKYPLLKNIENYILNEYNKSYNEFLKNGTNSPLCEMGCENYTFFDHAGYLASKYIGFCDYLGTDKAKELLESKEPKTNEITKNSPDIR